MIQSARFVILTLSALIIASSAGCALRVQPESAEFDTLYGRGPVLIAPSDEKAVSTAFFRKHWTTSQTIQHLVTQRGTPEAISVEREFLRPNRLKLFYPAQGQVYLLDQIGGEWLVAGSVPLEREELELVATQRIKNQIPPKVAPANNYPPERTTPSPLAAVAASSDFRGMLKPPTSARVATLSRGRENSVVHTVTFSRENLSIIADWYTENPLNATELARVNRQRVHTPLVVGQKLVIPANLLRNRDPLPEAMVP